MRLREEDEGRVKTAGQGSQKREPTVESLNIPGDHYCLLIRGLPNKFKLAVAVVELEQWPVHEYMSTRVREEILGQTLSQLVRV